MRGRKPTPTAIKMAAGNPGKRPINTQEPAIKPAIPPSPAVLSRAARAEWRRITPILLSAGLVTPVDLALLAAYCQVYGRWLAAETNVKKRGVVVKTRKGNLIQNPYLAIANRAIEQMGKIAAEFGLSPSARTRIHVDQADDHDLAELLFGEGVVSDELNAGR